MKNLSKDSLAMVLICSSPGLDITGEQLTPYTIHQWNKLAEKIAYSSLKRPEALFLTPGKDLEQELLLSKEEVNRLQRLLARSGQVGLEIERLDSMGIFITTRAEPSYPGRFKQVLKKSAPPVLYYAGSLDLLNQKAVAVVGSRDIDEAAMEFTRKLAERLVISKMNIVSGGAKGVDSLSQETALNTGGKVISVLSDGLASRIKSREVREAIMQGKLLLFSVVNPMARFTVYAAMDRNKLIYALADYAVVVSSSDNQGGTWAGATEDLKNHWTPLFVRQDPTAPAGNEKLLKLGARTITHGIVNDNEMVLDEWFRDNQGRANQPLEYTQLSLEAYICENTENYHPHK